MPMETITSSISIHALREEGDYRVESVKKEAIIFLSTPSARRATLWEHLRQKRRLISIHALREEGDGLGFPEFCYLRLFLSTPSARRATHGAGETRPGAADFYPRPPRGGRLHADHVLNQMQGFLSTPSARRATRQPLGLIAEHK